MENYSLGLALYDYLPVALSAFGLYLLATEIGRTLPASKLLALTGVALITAGGLCKASWKLIWVLGKTDIALLSNLLFILMAPGMIILAFHVFSAKRRWSGAGQAGRGPAVRPALWSMLCAAAVLALAAIAAVSQPGKTWFFTLLAAASLANISISGMLIHTSWGLRQRLTAAIFMFSILVILSLSGLSRISEGSAPLQWLAEILNTLAHGSFALAVWRLRKVIPNSAVAVPNQQ